MGIRQMARAARTGGEPGRRPEATAGTGMVTISGCPYTTV